MIAHTDAASGQPRPVANGSLALKRHEFAMPSLLAQTKSELDDDAGAFNDNDSVATFLAKLLLLLL